MKEKLLRHFLSLKPRTFVLISFMSLLSMDLLSCLYLVQSFGPEKFAPHTPLGMMLAARLGISPSELDPHFLKEMYLLMKNTLAFALSLCLLNNTFFYTFYTKGRPWAYKFVSGYCFFGAILNIFMVFDPSDMGPTWMVINLLMIPAYLYFYFGVKFLKESIILVPEKTAQ